MTSKVTVVGAGIGGMTAAITAAELGLELTLVEKGSTVGGAAAYSGGQVWTPANHVAARIGIDDSIGEALQYVTAAAHRDVASLNPSMCETWLRAAADAARYLEVLGVIEWELIPDYPDYYFPDLPGSKPAGRYLTGAAYDGARLGAAREHLHVSPHFPVGITYGEMFAWGGLSSKTEWDWELVARRRADDVLTFGSGIAAALYAGILARSVTVLREHAAVELVADDGAVVGVRCEGPDGDVVLEGGVILATGSHDWSPEHSGRFTGIPEADGGSVAPPTLSGDAMDLVAPLGGEADALPAWAAPVLPGYRIEEPAFSGDTRYRACYEHCLPHTFLVNRLGRRFAKTSTADRRTCRSWSGIVSTTASTASAPRRREAPTRTSSSLSRTAWQASPLSSASTQTSWSRRRRRSTSAHERASTSSSGAARTSRYAAFAAMATTDRTPTSARSRKHRSTGCGCDCSARASPPAAFAPTPPHARCAPTAATSSACTWSVRPLLGPPRCRVQQRLLAEQGDGFRLVGGAARRRGRREVTREEHVMPKREIDTSWEKLGFLELPNGSKTSRFVIGDEDDANAPVVFRVEFPPGCEVAAHTHDCDYCEIILEGSQQVTRRWHHVGDIRIAKAGTAYGPLIAGPEGCTVLVIFSAGNWPARALAKGDATGLHVDVLTGEYSSS